MCCAVSVLIGGKINDILFFLFYSIQFYSIDEPLLAQLRKGENLNIAVSHHQLQQVVHTSPPCIKHETECCGSWMFIPDHDFCPSRIPDPDFLSNPDPVSKNSYGTKEKGEKRNCFFVATNITKIKIIKFLAGEEKTLGQFIKNY
jgi:hypothetical protein